MGRVLVICLVIRLREGEGGGQWGDLKKRGKGRGE